MSSEGSDNFDLDDIDDDSDSGSDSGEPGMGAVSSVVGAARGFVAQLKEDLKKTPFDRELHVALLGALREEADLDRLSAARREAADRVSLPESLWLEWLGDETNLASGPGNIADLDVLHEEACRACPTARVWLLRCQFLQDQGGKPAEVVRAAYEEALNLLGSHPGEGPEIWADYRAFEERLLAEAGEGGEAVQHARRVRALFLRQLATPLPGIERLQEAHRTFEGALPAPAQDASAVAKAAALAGSTAAAWRQREPLEQKLQVALRPAITVSIGPSEGEEATPASVSAELLAQDKLSADPARLFTSFLRVTQYSSEDANLWMDFSDFAVATQLGAVDILERAVRHCPTCGELWLRLHAEHEAAGVEAAKLKSVLERGIAALGSSAAAGQEQQQQSVPPSVHVQELLLQHADSLRRRLSEGGDKTSVVAELRSTLGRAEELAQASGADGSACCQVLMQWMRLEAYAVRDPEATLKVGKRLMQLWGSYYNVWNSFIIAATFCLHQNTYAAVRDLYKMAMAQVADYPEQVKTDYVQFEREWGTLQSWRAARKKILGTAQISVAAAPVPEAPAEDNGTADAGGQGPGTGEAEAAQDVGEDQDAQMAEGDEAAEEPKPKRQRLSKRQRRVTAAQNRQAELAAAAEVSAKPQEEVSAKPQPAVAEPTSPAAALETAAAPPSVATTGSVQPAATQPAATHPPDPTEDQKPVAAAAAITQPTEAMTTTQPKKSADDLHSRGPAEPGEQASAHAGSAPAPEAATTSQLGKSEEDRQSTGPAEPANAQAGSAPAAEETQLTKPTPAQPTSATADTAATEQPKPTAPSTDQSAAQQDANPPAKPPQEDSTAAATATEAEETSTEQKRPHNGSHYHQKRLDPNIQEAPEQLATSEGERTVYVSNLDWSVDEPQLRRLFCAVDGLRDVRLIRDFLQRSKGFAYVDFETTEQVEAAVQRLNGVAVNKRPMKVARSLPTQPLFEERTLFVRNVAAASTDADVRQTFTQFGEVVAVRMPVDPASQAHKGYAYVEFAAGDAVKAALAKGGMELGGNVLQVSRSIPMKDHRHQTAAPRKDMPQRANQRSWLESKLDREDPVRQSAKFPTTVHVNNLAFQIDEEALRAHFVSCGEIAQVLIVRNGQGQSRGFGFIEFAEEAGAQAALLLTDSQLRGRDVVVSRSQRAITQKKSSAPAAKAGGPEAPAPASTTRPAAPKAAAITSSEPVQAQGKRGPPVRPPAVAAPAKRLRLEEEEQTPSKPEEKQPPVHRPFRSTKEDVKVEEPKKLAEDAKEPAAGPLTNKDFRALLLSGGLKDAQRGHKKP